MFEEDLIAAVHMHSCLYDQSLESYRSKVTKDKAWHEVADSIGVDVERCQARWKSLRDRFAKEVAKRLSPNYIPRNEIKWLHFDSLSFLTTHYAQRSKRANYRGDTSSSSILENTFDYIGTESEDMTNMPLEAEEDNSIGHQPNSIPDHTQLPNGTCMQTVQAQKRKKFADAGERLESIIDSVSDLITKTVQARVKRRNENFLMVVDEFLQKLPEDVQDRLKIDILNLVFAEVSRNQSQQ